MPGETELKVYLLSTLRNIPSFLLWELVAILGIGCAVLVLIKGWKGGLRATAFLLLLEWLFLILCTAIIFREVRVERAFNLIPFDSYFHYPENSYFIEAAAVNVLNVVMFIPVGLLLGIYNHNANANPNKECSKKGWLWVMALGAGFSLTVELLQFICKRGLFEMDDLIHNVAGCMIGYGIAAFAKYIAVKICK